MSKVEIEKIMQDYPELAYPGFFVPARGETRLDSIAREASERVAILEDRSVEQFDRCRDYIKAELGSEKDGGKILSSYFLKHCVEDWRKRQGDADAYVGNGIFIAAAISCGFRPRAIVGPNCNFSLSKSAYEAARKVRERSPSF